MTRRSLTISSPLSTSTARTAEKACAAIVPAAPPCDLITAHGLSGEFLQACRPTEGCLETRNVMAAIENFLANRSPQDDRIRIRPCCDRHWPSGPEGRDCRGKSTPARRRHRPDGHDRRCERSYRHDPQQDDTRGHLSAFRLCHKKSAWQWISKLWRHFRPGRLLSCEHDCRARDGGSSSAADTQWDCDPSR